MDFETYYRGRHRRAPFPWQRRAAKGPLPDAVDVPTAAGKTALVDIWHWRLTVGLPCPRRLVWVVDRRTIVDQVYQHALNLKRDSDIEVIRLRGGMPEETILWTPQPADGEKAHAASDEAQWSPTKPTVIVSTVDQAGSRLLHRGYGLSPRAWPIHAGLLGTDAWWVLDEAHLSQPFAETLRAVQQRGASVHVTVVSATLPETVGHIVRLDDEDERDPVLRPRLIAHKPARLVSLKAPTDGAAPGFVGALREVLERDLSIRTAAVVVNRVALARAIWVLAGNEIPDAEVVLLTGRSRSAERDALVEGLLPRIDAQRARSLDQPRLIVVATQCVEAGADFDFDALVTQVAPLDCLRQRFGRLDRLGQRGTSPAAIVATADDVKAKGTDPVYGTALAATWASLNQEQKRLGRQKKSARGKKSKEIDFGTRHLPVPSDDELPKLMAPRRSAPVLTDAQLDLWVRTYPIPSCSDDVAPWLHGPEAGPPDVQLVWRADLDETLNNAKEIVSLVPPLPREALSVPLWAVRAWLRAAAAPDFADVEGAPEPSVDDKRPEGREALRWRGATDERTGIVGPGQVRAGDTIVVRAGYGGCDRFGWAPDSSEPVTDLGERAGIVRVHRNVNPERWPDLAPLIDQESPASLLNALDVEGRIHWPYPRGEGCIVQIWSKRKQQHGAAVAMEAHSRAVEDEARAAAAELGLLPDVAADVALGAYFHDQGKADERAQVVLHGGELAWLASGEVLAKSAGWGGRLLPKGVRHEANSTRIALASPRFAEATDPDLVLWLAATHHGYGRPGWPAATVAEGWIDEVEWAERHARLFASYGPWRLAAMEAVVRLCDQRVSARGGV